MHGSLVLQRLADLVRQAELAVSKGESPEIENLIDGLSDGERSFVIKEVLNLELSNSSLHDQVIESYRIRFPEHHDLIAEVQRGNEKTNNAAPVHPTESFDTKSEVQERSLGSTNIDDIPVTTDLYKTEPSVGSGTTSARLRQLGDYDIVDELGRGGMGVVYKATQRLANRTVALKVIRADRLAGYREQERQAVIERFKSEARAAAVLDHENMVTVFEVGESNGEHFYSMRYVPGKSLSQILLDGPLEGVAAAKYMIGVCRAMQAAHDQQILHRDLKPSNIMVDQRTDRALVADFGLAKMLEQDQSATNTGAVVGTPPYMAPEQTIDSSKVTEAADIYGIGATLYHLLTGRPPFQAPSYAETIRQVNAENPVAPRRLNTSVHQDLETVTLKCLEKEPHQRYAAASEIESELSRFLKGDPIEARPLGPWKRGMRWAQRNKAIASAIGISATLAIGLLCTAVFGYLAVSAALVSEREAKRELEIQTAEVERQASHAKENLDLAFQAADRAFNRVATDSGLKRFGLEELRERLLSASLPFLEQFSKKAPENESYQRARSQALTELASVQVELGKLGAAEHNLDTALQLLEPFRKSKSRPDIEIEYAYAQLKRSKVLTKQNAADEGIEVLQNALARLEDIPNPSPKTQMLMATVCGNLGTCHNVSKQRYSQGLKYFEKAIAIREALRDENPNELGNIIFLAECYLNRGTTYLELNEVDAAKESYATGMSLLQTPNEQWSGLAKYWPTLMALHYQHATLFIREQEHAAAEPHIVRSVQAASQLAQTHPDVPEFTLRLAKSRLFLAEVQQHLNRPGENVDSVIHRAESDLQKLAERFESPEFRAEWANAIEFRGVFHGRRNEHEKQTLAFQQCLDIRKSLHERFPNSAQRKADLALAHYNLAVSFDALEAFTKSEIEYLASRRLYQQILEGSADQGWCAVDYTNVLNNLLNLYLQQKRLREATTIFQESMPLVDALSKSNSDVLLNQGRMQLSLGQQYMEDKNDPQAVSFLSQAIATCQQYLQGRADDENAKILLAGAHLDRAEIFGRLTRIEEGRDDWAKVLEYCPTVTRFEMYGRRIAWEAKYAVKPETDKE